MPWANWETVVRHCSCVQGYILRIPIFACRMRCPRRATFPQVEKCLSDDNLCTHKRSMHREYPLRAIWASQLDFASAFASFLIDFQLGEASVCRSGNENPNIAIVERGNNVNYGSMGRSGSWLFQRNFMVKVELFPAKNFTQTFTDAAHAIHRVLKRPAVHIA